MTGTGTSRPGTGDERLGSLFHRFWPFTHGLRRWMLLGLALTAVTPIIEAAEIWLFKLLVDEVLVPQDLEALPALVVAFVALNLASGAIGFGEVMTSAWVGERFLLRVRGSLFGHMLRLSPLQLGRRPLGDVLTRLSGDAAAIEGFLVAGPTAAVASVARVAIFAGMLVWIDPLLAALALVATPLFWLLGRRFSGAIRSAAREKRRRSGAVQALAEDVLSALPQVQAACAEDFERQRFEREGRAVVRAEMHASRILALFRPLTDLVELSGGLAVVVGGAWALSAGRLTLGELLAFMTYLTQLYAPVRDLTDLAASASTAAAGAERIAEVLDEEPVVADVDHGVQPTGLRGIVRFDDVSFRYPGTERWALERLSFEARPGTVTAVVGPSGAGKSTLVWLLLRMADAEGGAVLLDGHDVRTMSLRSLRSHVGVLLQDTYLFDGTVAENVAYGAEPHRSDEVDRALRAADADGFVGRLSQGVHSRLGPKGRTLSGGQRRRIALARALHDHRPVLILDEFSAGLDATSTARVLQTLRRSDRTVLVVTHDPAVAALADQILVVEDGRIRGADCVVETTHSDVEVAV